MPSVDERFMARALALAARGQGATRPNPMVGALVVRSGKIVGSAFHAAAGKPHAEVSALHRAGMKSRGATLYVTLEPCRHFGRTPPCAPAIAASGIRRVVAAMKDPNPLTQGRGLAQLRLRGIETKVGVLEEEARRLNEVFVTWMTKKRPFVTVKAAQSLDGKIATRSGSSKWISGPAARGWAQKLRLQVDAILVGVETVLKDNPRLTARGFAKQPIKVILDSQLRTPPTARIFSSRTPVIIAAAKTASREKERGLTRAGAKVLRLPSRDGKADLKSLLRELAKGEISHLLIEGGGEVIASAFAARAVDRIFFVMAPIVIGGAEAPTAVEGIGVSSVGQAVRLSNVQVSRVGLDLVVSADV